MWSRGRLTPFDHEWRRKLIKKVAMVLAIIAESRDDPASFGI